MNIEDIDNDIVDLMVKYGPDGHCDGHDKITAYVVGLLNKQSNVAIATPSQLKKNLHVVKLTEALNLISINIDPDSWDSDSDGRIAERALKEFEDEHD